MTNKDTLEKTTYLLAWAGDHDGKAHAYFECSTARLFRKQGVVSAGVVRGKQRVIAFCDHIHGDDYLSKDELRLVAACWLDENYETINIDLRD